MRGCRAACRVRPRRQRPRWPPTGGHTARRARPTRSARRIGMCTSKVTWCTRSWRRRSTRRGSTPRGDECRLSGRARPMTSWSATLDGVTGSGRLDRRGRAILEHMNDKPHHELSLGEFLSMRRGQLKPADVDIVDHGDRRRVPGLRREEVAQLAGVSVAYLIRLEQGLSLNASPQVLDALAAALALDETERRHLHDLSRDGRQRTNRRRLPPERVTPAIRQLLDAFGDTPAILVGRRSDVLGWTPAGHALFAGHLPFDGPSQPDRRPNTA